MYYPRKGKIPLDPWYPGLLDGYKPDQWWHHDPATTAQLGLLKRRGFEPPSPLTKGAAGWALASATPKQRRALLRFGLWQDRMSFDEAREKLAEVLGGEVY